MTRQVFLIDDDEDDAELFFTALDELKLGLSFVHFYDGIKAISTMETDTEKIPDIIFMDINMPSMDGWQCLRRIKAHATLNRIPIVMYSTSNIEREGLSASDMGAAAFLTKPTNFQELKRKLTRLFDQFGLRV